MLNSLSLSLRLTILSVSLVIILLAIGIFIEDRKNRNILTNLTIQQAETIGKYHATQISADLDRAMTIVAGLKSSFEAIKATDPHKKENYTREIYNKILYQAMEQFPFLAGAWAGFEPNKLDERDKEYQGQKPFYDETGRYTSYFYNFGGGITPYRLTDLAGAENRDDPDYAYYNTPLLSKKPAVVDPVLYDIEGNEVLLPSFTFPILNQSGESIGVIGVDMDVNAMSENISKLTPFEVGSVDLISNNGLWVSHQNKENFGKPVAETSTITNSILEKIKQGETHILREDEITKIFVPVHIKDVNTPWSIVVNIPNTKMSQTADQQSISLIIGGIILSVIVGLALYFIGTAMIRKPLKTIIGTIDHLQNHQFDLQIPDQERTDEIGQVNKALEIFRQNSLKMERLEKEQEADKQRLADEKKREQLQLADNFEKSICEIVRKVSNSSHSMSDAAHEMSDTVDISRNQAISVSSSAEEASVNVQTVASSTEELSASINEISHQVTRSTAISSDAVNEVERTNGMVHSLAQAADKIGEVVSLINDIADQTNLLALNATIEAACAGDAGKGFAIVASEVKNLANQTASATEEIVQQISAIQGETKGTVDAIGNIGKTIQSIHSVATTIAAAVEEQEAATREISHSIQQAAMGTSDVSANVEGIRQTADVTGAAAEKVQTAAKDLNHESQSLDSQVTAFLKQIREGC